MNCKRQIDKILTKYGKKIKIRNFLTESEGLAIIQLMRYKNKMYVDLPISEIGVRDTGCYLYIGSPENDFTENWRNIKIEVDGHLFGIKRAHMIYCGKQPFYQWAILYRRCSGGAYERS